MASIVTIGSSRSSITTTIGASGFVVFGSAQIAPSTTEAQTQVPVYINGVIRNMRIGVAAIVGVGVSYTIRLRKNGANGNLVISSINATGAWTDTTNSDLIQSGNLVNYSVTRAAGTSITLGVVSSEFYNEEGVNILGAAALSTATFQPNQASLIGIGDLALTNSNQRTFTFANGYLKNLSAYISANSLNAGITYIFPLIAAVATTNPAAIPSLNLAIAAATTGLFTDTTDIFPYTNGDRWYFESWRSGSSTGTISNTFFMIHDYAEKNTITYNVGRSVPALTTNNTLIPIMGSMLNGAVSPEAAYQTRIPSDCILYPENIKLSPNTNTNAVATVFHFRVNGVNSAASASIPANSTAVATGGGQPVILKTGDLVNYIINDNGAAGTLQLRAISTAFRVDTFDPSSDFIV